jgi:hypothetical protein
VDTGPGADPPGDRGALDRLLAHQYQPAPKGALTVKVTGYQWYWGYTYPDNGGFEVISNMLPPAEAVSAANSRNWPPTTAWSCRPAFRFACKPPGPM